MVRWFTYGARFLISYESDVTLTLQGCAVSLIQQYKIASRHTNTCLQYCPRPKFLEANCCKKSNFQGKSVIVAHVNCIIHLSSFR